ncbi:hypothetical protein IQ277_11770 [Nostocales cyanobacterium LEGE 12452]|nr:hypothetical protein [Nostocales cyanobacterium LEGE 12452]
MAINRRKIVFGLSCIISSIGIERQLMFPKNADEQRLLEESATKLNLAYNSLDN